MFKHISNTCQVGKTKIVDRGFILFGIAFYTSTLISRGHVLPEYRIERASTYHPPSEEHHMKSIGSVYKFVIGETTPHAVANALTSLGHEGATINSGLGLWQGTLESNVTVEIAGLDAPGAEYLALVLCGVFDQDAIYVEHKGEAFLVESEAPREEQVVTFTQLVDGLDQMEVA